MVLIDQIAPAPGPFKAHLSGGLMLRRVTRTNGAACRGQPHEPQHQDGQHHAIHPGAQIAFGYAFLQGATQLPNQLMIRMGVVPGCL